MAEKPKGGRGKTAPYFTTHIRVPEALIDQCREMVDFYREYIEDGGDPDNPPRYIVRPLRKESSPGQRLMDMLNELD
jgi:hypothetical protein